MILGEIVSFGVSICLVSEFCR